MQDVLSVRKQRQKVTLYEQALNISIILQAIGFGAPVANGIGTVRVTRNLRNIFSRVPSQATQDQWCNSICRDSEFGSN